LNFEGDPNEQNYAESALAPACSSMIGQEALWIRLIPIMRSLSSHVLNSLCTMVIYATTPRPQPHNAILHAQVIYVYIYPSIQMLHLIRPLADAIPVANPLTCYVSTDVKRTDISGATGVISGTNKLSNLPSTATYPDAQIFHQTSSSISWWIYRRLRNRAMPLYLMSSGDISLDERHLCVSQEKHWLSQCPGPVLKQRSFIAKPAS
jgi:hypothetical protein